MNAQTEEGNRSKRPELMLLKSASLHVVPAVLLLWF